MTAGRRKPRVLQGADAYQANPCLWLWGPLRFSDLVAAGGFTFGSCWAWSCLCLPPDPSQPPAPIPGLPAHPQGLSQVGWPGWPCVGVEGEGITLSGKWGRGGFAGETTTALWWHFPTFHQDMSLAVLMTFSC